MSSNKNILLQDIFHEKDALVWPEKLYEMYKSTLIPFSYGLAEPVEEETLKKDTLFQIVDITDISKSTISMIDTLTDLTDVNEGFYDLSSKSKLRGRRRTTINEVNVNEVEKEVLAGDTSQPNQGSVYRLTLQDCFGNLCYAYEHKPLSILRNPSCHGLFRLKLGYKLVVCKGTKIIFNTLHLEDANIKKLGGSIDKLNFKLYERKLKELKAAIAYKG